MANPILTSGQLIEYAAAVKIGPVNPERYLALQIAYSLAVLRETAVATAAREPVGGWVDSNSTEKLLACMSQTQTETGLPGTVTTITLKPGQSVVDVFPKSTPKPVKPESLKKRGRWTR